MSWRKIKSFFGLSSGFLVVNAKRAPKGAILNTAVPLAVGDDGFMKVVPVGDFPDHPDGAHSISPADIEQMLYNIQRTGDVLIDRDHSSLKSEDGLFQSTEAVGWGLIANFQARPDGLYLKAPEWVGEFGEKVSARAYRYWSPVYIRNHSTAAGKIGYYLDSLAVTNRPNMLGLIDPIRNSRTEEESEMNFTDDERKKLIAKYKLAEDASDDVIKAALLAEEKPGETKPGETKPGETKPGETKPGETKPGETKPGETKPAEGDPVANSAAFGELIKTVTTLSQSVDGLVKNSQAIQKDKDDTLIKGWITTGRMLPSDEKMVRNSLRADRDETIKEINARPAGMHRPMGLHVNSAPPKKKDDGTIEKPSIDDMAAELRAANAMAAGR